MSKSNWTSNWTFRLIFICCVMMIILFFLTLHFFSLFEMPPPKHPYAKYVTVLNEKANKSNYFALCCYCKIKIINTKRLIIYHLKSCKKFEKNYTEDERDRILYPEKYENRRESSFSSSSLSRY
jgi:hypothetical protein